ncbi:MAG: hypothetical protein U1F33_01750 [Alphaproteobacteria bacterium]
MKGLRGRIILSTAAGVFALVVVGDFLSVKREALGGAARAEAAVVCHGMRPEQRTHLVQVAGSGEMLRMASSAQLADGSSAATAGDDNLDLFEKLGLMEGHLMIGKALLDANMQKAALPHFGHPVREIYDYLKPVFAERKYPEFERELQDLERRAKAAPRDAATGAAYDDVIKKIDGLRKTIPAEMQRSRRFAILGVAVMIEAAAGDLGESLDKGRIVNTVEYHDAMGFARYADAYARAQADLLGPQAPAIAKEIQLALSAFPALEPPAKPTRSVSQVQGAADRVKALAN